MSKKLKKRETLDEILASCEFGKASISVNSKDAEGDTPLHVMLWRENNYAVTLLIEAGADVNAKGDMSETPLHIALRKENRAAIEMLLKAGARKTPISEFGQSPQNVADELGGEISQLFNKL